MKRECVCGAETNTQWTEVCSGCGRFYHGQEDRGGVDEPIWGVRPPASRRPRGDNLVTTGWLIAAAGAALYFIAYAVPATIAVEPSAFDRLYRDATPAIELNPWRLVLFAIGGGLFALGPLVWATGQIVRALWWLQQEPEPAAAVKVDTRTLGSGEVSDVQE